MEYSENSFSAFDASAVSIVEVHEMGAGFASRH